MNSPNSEYLYSKAIAPYVTYFSTQKHIENNFVKV